MTTLRSRIAIGARQVECDCFCEAIQSICERSEGWILDQSEVDEAAMHGSIENASTYFVVE